MSLASILLVGLPGGPEMLLILFAILLLFGAKKIPELARGLGKGIREFKDASKEIKREIDTEAKRIDPNQEA
ncbi:MAG: twin-arginine translocase TatA/TatE family subunit [Bacteroidia bacterium]|nr:twin-arginine translocase TatA/TatE family subunit [Bacteroidia bacterium]